MNQPSIDKVDKPIIVIKEDKKATPNEGDDLKRMGHPLSTGRMRQQSSTSRPGRPLTKWTSQPSSARRTSQLLLARKWSHLTIISRFVQKSKH